MLTRTDYLENRTIGTLRVPGLGTYYTVEDKVRDVKIKGKTAIWAGKYKLSIRKEGGMFSTWSKRQWVKDWISNGGNFLGFIWILDIKDFTFVYLHAGNDEDDTEGCVIIGKGLLRDGGVLQGVSSSRDAMKEIYDYLTPKIEAGENWFIEVR